MKSPKIKYALLLLIPLLVIACSLGTSEATQELSPESPQEQATAVEPTQAPTEVPTAVPTYPAQDICDQMAALIEQNLNLPVEIKSDAFDDPSGLSGPGCTVIASGTGEVVTNWGDSNNNLYQAIQAQGWVQDFNFSAGGAGGSLDVFRRNGYVIRYLSESGPVDRNLCSQNEPFTVCMDRLAPEQRLFTVTINASADSYDAGQAAGPAKDACDQMAALIEQNINLPVEIKPDMFSEPSGLSGPGCTVTAIGTGDVVTNWGDSNNNLYQAIQAQGWVQDFNFSAGGAGGSLDVFRRNGFVCQYLSEARPVDMNLCSQNEPLPSCMDRLSPSQRLFSVTISCSPDSYTPGQ